MWRKNLLSLFVYLLASCLFMGVIVDSLQEGESLTPLSLLIASLLWPLDAVLAIYEMLRDSLKPNEPDN